MSIVAPAKSNRPSKTSRIASWEWWALLYLRLALGVSFLSGIADRFGLYKGRNVGYGNFAGFVQYTAKVNSFMPASMIPFPAGAATISESSFGGGLLIGFWVVFWGRAGKLLAADLIRHGNGYLVRN